MHRNSIGAWLRLALFAFVLSTGSISHVAFAQDEDPDAAAAEGEAAPAAAGEPVELSAAERPRFEMLSVYYREYRRILENVLLPAEILGLPMAQARESQPVFLTKSSA